ncbi:MAG: sigma-70 family RNA polymerase sigma factor [Thermovirgaceae bacterium]
MDERGRSASEGRRISEEEERSLWRKAAGGDEEARDRLILLHRPLVFWIAGKFRVSPQQYQDLVQEGMIALIKAVDRFDPDRQTRFATYGYYRIRGQMANYLQRVEAKAPQPVDQDAFQLSDGDETGRIDWLISIMDQVKELPEKESDVIEALVFQGKKASEYALERGVDVSHIYRLQRKAYARIRSLLGLEATEHP